jgi:Family of unknown function (DUF5989)
MTPGDDNDFVDASRKRRTPLWLEIWALLRENKKWWLTPIVLAILLLGVLSLLAGSAVAPFIYTLF